MKVIKIELEKYIYEEIEKAKYRNKFLGVHFVPSKKPKKLNRTMKGKSGRIKEFHFNTSYSSWNDYIQRYISFEEMKEMQKQGI
jgi:hypothetical protein